MNDIIINMFISTPKDKVLRNNEIYYDRIVLAILDELKKSKKSDKEAILEYLRSKNRMIQ